MGSFVSYYLSYSDRADLNYYSSLIFSSSIKLPIPGLILNEVN